MKNETDNIPSISDNQKSVEGQNSRRDALKKLGKYAYATPVVLAVLSKDAAGFQPPPAPSFPSPP